MRSGKSGATGRRLVVSDKSAEIEKAVLRSRAAVQLLPVEDLPSFNPWPNRQNIEGPRVLPRALGLGSIDMAQRSA
jgi:hypothetical protein